MSGDTRDLEKLALYPHGTRARYVSKCRCEECRAANRAYQKERDVRKHEMISTIRVSGPPIPSTMIRQGREERIHRCPGVNGDPCARGGLWLRAGLPVCDRCLELGTVWNGRVDGARAREHIAWLRKNGVGLHAIAEACGLVPVTLARIVREGSTLRRENERRILAVTLDARAPGALVPAKRSRQILARLRRLGMRNRAIAIALGGSATGLQIATRSRVLRETEHRLERLLAKVESGKIVPEPAYVPAAAEIAWLRAIRDAGASLSWIEERLGWSIHWSTKSQLRPAKRDQLRQLRLEIEGMTLTERRLAWPRYRGATMEASDAAE